MDFSRIVKSTVALPVPCMIGDANTLSRVTLAVHYNFSDFV